MTEPPVQERQTEPKWSKRFSARGVFWRQLLTFGVFNLPLWLEPIMIGWWSLMFLLWGPGRRGVMNNLGAIKPGSSGVANFLRTYRVFWNYSWTIADAARFRELRTVPDWEFEGLENFEQMATDPAGAILLTAHMGSYDLGAHLFAETSGRNVIMVRAPEQESLTQDYEEGLRNRGRNGSLRVGFNTQASELAFDLLEALQGGQIVAIQGDRITAGIASMETTLFGQRVRLPAGPFALAMASRVTIYPMFVIRAGRRRYRLVACPPIRVVRSSRNREVDLQRGLESWRDSLERTVSQWWMQWFAFESISMETLE